MIESKSAMLYVAFTPSFAATALKRSMSQPTALPLASLYSFGAYLASTPTWMTPAFLMAAGRSFAAAASVPPVFTVPPEVDGVSLLTQPDRARAAATATTGIAYLMRIGGVPYLCGEGRVDQSVHPRLFPADNAQTTRV